MGRLELLGGAVQLWKGTGPKCTFTSLPWGVTIHPSLSGTWVCFGLFSKTCLKAQTYALMWDSGFW